MSPLPRLGWLFLIEFLKWYFSKYWQVRTRPVFTQTVTYITLSLLIAIFATHLSLPAIYFIQTGGHASSNTFIDSYVTLCGQIKGHSRTVQNIAFK